MAFLRKTTNDPNYDAVAALLANTSLGDMLKIRGTALRLAHLVRRLEKFSFPLVAQPLAELLIRPENHTATTRIEALIHLAALAYRGKKRPTLWQLRKWLNVWVFKGPLLEEHGRRRFQDAATDHDTKLGDRVGDDIVDTDFEATFIAEFGLKMDQYGEFVVRVTLEALEQGTATHSPPTPVSGIVAVTT